MAGGSSWLLLEIVNSSTFYFGFSIETTYMDAEWVEECKKRSYERNSASKIIHRAIPAYAELSLRGSRKEIMNYPLNLMGVHFTILFGKLGHP